MSGSQNTVPASGRGLPKALVLALEGMLFGALFAACAAAIDTLVLLFEGSYVSGGIIWSILAWWAFAGGAAGLVLAILSMPAAVFLSRRAAGGLVGAAVLACGFLAYMLNVAVNTRGGDAFGASILLSWWFLALWASLLGALFVIVVMHGGGRVFGWYLLGMGALLFPAGLSYHVGEAAALAIIGPLFLLAVTGMVYEKLPGITRKVFPPALAACYAAVLAATAAVQGGLAAGPIDTGFTSEPAQVAMLAGKPSVILVTLDTARADRMSLCGHEYPTTPYLERFARDCRFFPNGVTVNSWTLPAHASLFTGKYSRSHGAHGHRSRTTVASDRSKLNGIPLAASQVTLATLLRAKGYNTAAFTSNYVWLGRHFGLNQGFSYYHDLPRYLVFTRREPPLYARGMDCIDRLLGMNGKFLQSYYSARTVSRFGMRWVREHAGEPFLLFLNYMDTHEPYSPPKGFDRLHGEVPVSRWVAVQKTWHPFRDRYTRDGGAIDSDVIGQILNQYDGEMAYMDAWFGRFVESLKESGVYDDSLIIVLSDHGEFFGEHQLLNHGVGVYEGGVRIPILVKYPGSRHAGERVEERVSIMDVFATVLEELRFADPDSQSEPLGAVSHPIIAEDYENGVSVRAYGKRFERNQVVIYDGAWKFILKSRGGSELYDLSADPREERNVAAAHPQVCRRLEAAIAEWKKRTPAFDGTSALRTGPSRELINRLRSLGYTSGD